MTTKSYPATTFPRFNELPKELRLSIWEFAIPGPRVVEVVERAIKPSLTDLARQIDEWKSDPRTIPQDLVGTFKSNEEILERLQWIYENQLSSQPLDTNLLKDSQPLTNIYSPCPSLPAILFAYHESYEVAVKKYERAFDSKESVLSFGQTWFDFERDVLYLRWDTYRASASGSSTSGSSTSVSGAFKSLVHGLSFAFDPQTRGRVRNLAILVREEEIEDSGEGFDVEWIVGHVLFAFPGLKRLDLVLRHVGSERTFEGSECSESRGAIGEEMRLWDMSDVERAVEDMKRGGERGRGLSLVTLKHMRGAWERFAEKGVRLETLGDGVDVRFKFVVGY